MATFRTDPNTGRAVISEENRVDRSGLSGRRGSTVQSRTSGGPNQSDGPTGGFGPPVGFDFGTGTAAGTLSPQEFMNVTGRTATNPYGKQGFFSRVFGLDPSKIDYTNNFGRNRGESQGIMATLNNRAYNAYLNPVDLSTGFVNPMLDEGSLTRFGRVERDPNLRQGIGGFGLPAVISNLFDRSDLVVPGQPASDARRQDIGIFDFEIPRNMDELVSSALGEQAPRSVDGLTDLEAFEPFTTDLDVRNPESYFADINTRRQETPVTPGFTRPDDAMPTVADVLAAAPMVTSEYEEMVGATPEESGTYIVGSQIAPTSTSRMVYTIEGTTPAEQAYLREIRDDDLMYDYDRSIPTGSTVLQNIPGGDPGSASITVNPQTQTPTYVAPDQPVDLLSDILAPDGSILPGVRDVIAPSQAPRSGGRDIILVMPDGRIVDSRNVGR
jgi:hypothetical protein